MHVLRRILSVLPAYTALANIRIHKLSRLLLWVTYNVELVVALVGFEPTFGGLEAHA